MSPFKKILFLLAAPALALAFRYTYTKGLYDGEWNYKRSHRMYMALKSAYHYGYMDGHDGLREDWDGPSI